MFEYQALAVIRSIQHDERSNCRGPRKPARVFAQRMTQQARRGAKRHGPSTCSKADKSHVTLNTDILLGPGKSVGPLSTIPHTGNTFIISQYALFGLMLLCPATCYEHTSGTTDSTDRQTVVSEECVKHTRYIYKKPHEQRTLETAEPRLVLLGVPAKEFLSFTSGNPNVVIIASNSSHLEH